MKAVKKAASILLSVVLWAIILVAALFTFTTMATRDTAKVSSVAGYTPLSVKSDSMAPTFSQGDLIIIKKCDTAKLNVGDIVCFHTIIENQYALNTHRIVNIEQSGGYRSYVTRGDNNLIEDQSRIIDGDIVGKYVTKLGGVGKLMDFLSSSTGFLVVIVLPLLAFFIYQVYHLIMISVNLKKAAMVEAAEAAAQASAQVSMQPSAEAQEAQRLKAEAQQAKAQAEAALAEALRLKEQAQAQLDRAKQDEAQDEAQ